MQGVTHGRKGWVPFLVATSLGTFGGFAKFQWCLVVGDLLSEV